MKKIFSLPMMMLSIMFLIIVYFILEQSIGASIVCVSLLFISTCVVTYTLLSHEEDKEKRIREAEKAIDRCAANCLNVPPANPTTPAYPKWGEDPEAYISKIINEVAEKWGCGNSGSSRFIKDLRERYDLWKCMKKAFDAFLQVEGMTKYEYEYTNSSGVRIGGCIDLSGVMPKEKNIITGSFDQIVNNIVRDNEDKMNDALFSKPVYNYNYPSPKYPNTEFNAPLMKDMQMEMLNKSLRPEMSQK